MTAVVVRSYPQGPRVWIAGQRVHHGATGVALLAAAALTRRQRAFAATLGLVLAAHDRHDWKVWFIRECVPAGELLDIVAPAP